MRRNRGFTLIELLVVVAIIVILIAILMPSLGRARSQAKNTQCMSNMKQWGVGFFMYAQDNNDHIPPCWASGPIASISNPTYSTDPRALSEGSAYGPVGMGRLLPYMNYTGQLTNAGIRAYRPKYAACPAAPEYDASTKWGWLANTNFTDYTYNRDGVDPALDTTNAFAHLGFRWDGVQYNGAYKLNNIPTRNLSYCIAAGFNTLRFPGGHMDGSNFLFGDGHVEHLMRSQYTAFTAAAYSWWENDDRWRH